MTVYNKASLVLAESPAYKAGKIQPYYPLTPDVSFDFTRATSATRVNASGNIEKETQNLLLQSNQFDTTWGSVNTTETSGQAGYDGTNDAWLLSITASGAYLYQEKAVSGVQTFSFFAKEGTLARVNVVINASVNVTAQFDLANGIVLGGSQNITSSISSIGNGWYRCSITYDKGTTNRFRLYPVELAGGGTSGNIYIQDAQLEQGLVARDYQETTTSEFYGGITDNVPRLDYTDGSCPSVLLEPQRTNLVTQSEYIDSWTDYTNGNGSTPTITTNYAVSPEGLTNATRLQLETNGSASNDASGVLESIVLDGSSTYIFSFWIKSNSGSSAELSTFVNSSFGVQFTATTEWQRLDFEVVSNSTNPRNFGIIARGNYQQSIDVSFWGAQLEIGSYATSYIPTYGTSVTREADGELYKDLAANNFIGDTFSIFFEIDNVNYGTANSNFNYLNSSIGGSAMYVYGSTLGIHTTTGDDYSTFLQGFTNPKGGKFLAVYNGSNVKIYKDGSLYRTISNPSARWDNVTIYRLRMYSATATSSYKSLMIFPTALSDDECIALTTL